MQARVIVSPNGELSVFVESGTFESAKPAIERLLAQLQAQGMNVTAVTPVEQHTHDTETQEHAHTHTTTQ